MFIMHHSWNELQQLEIPLMINYIWYKFNNSQHGVHKIKQLNNKSNFRNTYDNMDDPCPSHQSVYDVHSIHEMNFIWTSYLLWWEIQMSHRPWYEWDKQLMISCCTPEISWFSWKLHSKNIIHGRDLTSLIFTWCKTKHLLTLRYQQLAQIISFTAYFV